MKRPTYYISILLCIYSLFSCQRTEIGDTDLDFSIQTSTNELTTFIGMPASFSVSLSRVDAKNDYPFSLTITFSQGVIEYDGKQYSNEGQTQNLAVDKPEKEILFTFTPEQLGKHKITLIFENELVKKEKTFTIDCSKYLYTIRTENIPEKTFVDKEFNFDLIVEEAENTLTDSIFVYARLKKGKGILKYGNSQLNTDEDTKTRILIGRNQLSYLPQTDGETQIRFFVVNKWNHTTEADAIISVAYPQWDIKIEQDTLLIPLKEDFSFNLEIEQEDSKDESTYISSFRFASAVQNYALTVNSEKVIQGKNFNLKSGVNVVSIKANEAGTGYIEFFVRDRYKKERIKKLFFEIKLPVRPIEAALDQTSIQQYENEKATFKLSISEKNYFETFTVKIEQLDGKGIFTTGKEMRVSQGTHDISYVPDEIGTHTFRINIYDNNNQSVFLNGTVQVEKNPLITLLTSVGGTVSGGGSWKYNSDVSIEAKNDAGYRFVGWYENGIRISSEKVYKIKALKNRTLEAIFSKEKYTVTVSSTAGGKATGSGTFEYGIKAALEAIPDKGHIFIGWYDGDKLISSAPNFDFFVDGNTKLQAKFGKDSMTLTVTSTSGGTATGTGAYEYGTNATLTAKNDVGYKFSGWYINDKLISSSLQLPYKVLKSVTIEARFTKLKYTLTISSDPLDGGEVTGSGVYEYQEQATILVKAAAEYSFAGLYENGKLISSDLTSLYDVTKNAQLVAKFTRNKVDLTVTSTAGGTATGTGAYEYGTNATLTAKNDVGYKFSGWYIDGKLIGSSLQLSYKVLKSVTIEARFTKLKYTLTVSTSPLEAGSVAGSGVYEYGTQATISVKTEIGYSFIGLYENDKLIGSDPTLLYEVKKNAQIVAKFTRNKINLTVTSTSGGTATGTGAYEYGTNTTFIAKAETGYKFSGWYIDGKLIGSSLQLPYRVEKSVTIEARFTKLKYTLSISSDPLDGGTVTGAKIYEYQEQATISVTAKEGYSFAGLYENGKLISSELISLYSVTKNTQLVAKFTRNKINITVTSTSGGTSTGTGAYEYGTNTTFTAKAETGYKFSGWYIDGKLIGSSLQLSYKVEKSVTIEARFIKEKYTLTVTSTSGGTATGTGVYEYGTQVTLEAKAETEYIFDGWYIGTSKVESSPLYLLDITKNTQIIAKFIRKKLNITVKSTSGGTATGTGAYEYGTNITPSAKVEAGYKFVGWYIDGKLIGSSLQLSYKVEKSVTIEARFTKEKYTLTVTPTAGGTATGGGTFEYNMQATLTATTQVGHYFVAWFINNSQRSTTNPYLYTVTGNTQIEARFAKQKYTLKLTATEGGSVSAGGVFEYGTTVPITATPKVGYKFVGLFQGAKLISDKPNASITLTSDLELIAKFEVQTFNVSIKAQGIDFGSSISTGDKSFSAKYGEKVQLTANILEPKGQTFAGWYINGLLHTENTSLNVTVDKDLTILAKFVNVMYTVRGRSGRNQDCFNEPKKQFKYDETITLTSSCRSNWMVYLEGVEGIYYNDGNSNKITVTIKGNLFVDLGKPIR